MKDPKSSLVRLRRLLLILVIGALLLTFGVSFLGGSYVRSTLLAQLEERFGGPATLDDLDLSIFGTLALDGLRATDASGETVFSVQSLEASVAPISLLGFYPELDAELNDFELTLRQLPDESWNYAGWFPDSTDEENSADEGLASAWEAREHLPFFGKLSLAAGRLVLVANDGTTRLESIEGVGAVEENKTLLSMGFDAELVPSEMLRSTGALEDRVGVHAELEGDLARGPEQTHWMFNLALLNGGGKLKLNGQISPAVLLGSDPAAEQETGLSLGFDASSLGLSAKIMPLLAMLHPVFNSISGLEDSAIGGLLDGQLNLNYRGALNDLEDPLAWLSSSLGAISGDGSLAIDGAHLGAAPMIQQMVDYLGVKSRELSLDPLSFSIREGRVTYDQGWGWKIGSVRTSFTGSVGLDGSLDLSWSAPVTEEVIAKHSFLRHLKGKSVDIPIGGSMQSPSLRIQDALESLGSDLVQGEVLDKLGLEEVPDLDDLLSEGLGQLGLGKAASGSDDPAQLYRQANKLWDAGKKAEAALIYAGIRSDHKATLTYTLNRSRIKKRAKYTD